MVEHTTQTIDTARDDFVGVGKEHKTHSEDKGTDGDKHPREPTAIGL